MLLVKLRNDGTKSSLPMLVTLGPGFLSMGTAWNLFGVFSRLSLSGHARTKLQTHTKLQKRVADS